MTSAMKLPSIEELGKFREVQRLAYQCAETIGREVNTAIPPTSGIAA